MYTNTHRVKAILMLSMWVISEPTVTRLGEWVI